MGIGKRGLGGVGFRHKGGRVVGIRGVEGLGIDMRRLGGVRFRHEGGRVRFRDRGGIGVGRSG